MKFQEFKVVVEIINKIGQKTESFVDVVVLIGEFKIGSVLKELHSNHPNC